MTDDASTGRAPIAAPVRIPLHNRSGDEIAATLVSHEDAALALKRWHLSGQGYAVRMVLTDEWLPTGKHRQRAVLLHREILGLEFGDALQGDHRDGDRLNNQRDNLRVVSVAWQRQNRRPQGGVSEHRGVAFFRDGRRRPWVAYANVAGKRTNIGFFATEDEAGAAAKAWRLTNMPGAVD